MVRSIDETAAGLGVDGDCWRGVFGLLMKQFDTLARRHWDDVADARIGRS